MMMMHSNVSTHSHTCCLIDGHATWVGLFCCCLLLLVFLDVCQLVSSEACVKV